LYVRNVLHFKLVKLSQFGNPAPALAPAGLEDIKSGTALPTVYRSCKTFDETVISEWPVLSMVSAVGHYCPSAASAADNTGIGMVTAQ